MVKPSSRIDSFFHCTLPNGAKRIEDKLLAISIALLPLFYLTVKNWTESWLVILTLVSVYGLLKNRVPVKALFPDVKTKLIFASLNLPFITAFIGIIIRGELDPDHLAYNLDVLNGPSRLMLAGVSFLWMNYRHVNFLRTLSLTLPFTIILTLFFTTVQQPGVAERYTTHMIDLDNFSHQMCTLGILQVVLLLLLPPRNITLMLLNVVSLIIAVKLAIGSGGRGGWVAVPPVLLVFAFLYRGPKLKLLALSALVCLTLVTVLYANKPFRQRISSIYSETQSWVNGSKSVTSAGHRMSMWLISFELIKSNPIRGYGSKANLWKPVYEMDPSRYLRPGFTYEDEEAARFTLCDTGEHNEYLLEFLTNGILGFAAKLLLLLIPCAVFFSKIREVNGLHYAAGLTGICFVLAFTIFGITQGPFSLKLVCSFYGFVIAGLAVTGSDASRDLSTCNTTGHMPVLQN